MKLQRSQLAAMNIHYTRYSLAYCLAAIQREGFESIAFWGGPPHFHLDRTGYQDAKALRGAFAYHGLACTCFTAPALLPGNQFAIDGKSHIEDTFRYFSNGVRVAAELGAGVMVVNSGYGLFNEPREEGWRRAADMLRRVAEVGREQGVVLTLESLRPPETRLVVTLEDTRRMLAEVDHPHCKAMVDTTAMAVSGESLRQWFSALGGDIQNLHFIDAAPFGHLAWGDGILPLADMVACLEEHHYTGPIGFEITDGRYFAQPALADRQNMRALARFVES